MKPKTRRPRIPRQVKKNAVIILIQVGLFHVVDEEGKSHFTGSYNDCVKYVKGSTNLIFKQS